MPRCVNFGGICPGEVPDYKIGTICPDCALDQGLFVERGQRLYKCAAEDCDGRVKDYSEGTVCPVCHRDQYEKYIQGRDVFCHTWKLGRRYELRPTGPVRIR